MLRCLFVVLAGVLALTGAEPVQEFHLPNGLRVLLAENHERPLVRLELRTSWSPALEPPGKPGLSGFLAELLRAGGTVPGKREASQRFLEDRALRLAFTMHERSFAWSILSDSQGQDGAFESLALAATRQDFDATVVELRRQRLLQEAKEKSPVALAEERFRRRIGDPEASWLPEADSLVRIEFQDLLALSRRILRPETSILVIHGDMNLPQARQLALLHLGAWGPSGTEASPPEPAPAQRKPVRTWLARLPGKTIRIRVGFSRPRDLDMPETTRGTLAWLVKREVRATPVPGLASAELEVFPEGGWRLDATSGPDRTLAETMAAVQQLLVRLRAKRIEPAEWTTALKAWGQEKQTRSLHPRQVVETLAQSALQAKRPEAPEGSLSATAVQATLGQLFAAEDCSYLVLGAIPQAAAWLDQAGFGPVESVN